MPLVHSVRTPLVIVLDPIGALDSTSDPSAAPLVPGGPCRETFVTITVLSTVSMFVTMTWLVDGRTDTVTVLVCGWMVTDTVLV